MYDNDNKDNNLDKSSSIYSYGRDHNYYDKDEYANNTYYNNYENINSGRGYESYQFTESVQTEKKGKKPEKKQSSFKKGMKGVVWALVFGIVAGVGFQATEYVADVINPSQKTESTDLDLDLNTTDSISTTGEINKSAAENAIETTSTSAVTTVTDVSAVVDEVMPSVVSITNIGTQTMNDFFGQQGVYESESSGSGIIIGENDTELLVVTNNHVVSGADTISVTFIDDTTVNAQVKGTDASIDLAVLAISLEDISEDTAGKIKMVVLGDSDSLQVGEPAIAIGNALGYGQSVTTGVISALNREVTVDKITNELIQTDAAINPGNSGGALLNMKGELIGINAVKFASSGVEGMGYAIPISSATPIINELMNKETRTKVSTEESSYLGIAGVDVTSDVASTYNMPIGVYVAQVVEGSAAETARIEKGYIITEFDGNKISSMAELQSLLEYYAAGTTIEVKVQYAENNEYKEKSLTVTLGKKTETTTSNRPSLEE